MKFVGCVVLVVSVAGMCGAGSSLHAMLEDKESDNIWALLVAGSNSWMNYRHQVGVYLLNVQRNCNNITLSPCTFVILYMKLI